VRNTFLNGHPMFLSPASASAIQFDLAAIDADSSFENANTSYIREGVGIIAIVGPISRYKDMFSRMFNLPTIDGIREDFLAFERDPTVHQIILNIDSPGGDARGLFELVGTLRSGKKHLISYVESLAASAAYLIASAANDIVISEAASVGSIGVVASFSDMGSEGIVTYVSTQSPFKNLSPGDAHFDENVQARIDHLADLFIRDVALNMGVTPENVLENFGKGDIILAEDALLKGMISGIGTFESLFNNRNTSMNEEELQAKYPELFLAVSRKGSETLELKHAEALAASKKEMFKEGVAHGQTSEAKRIAEIDSLALPGHEDLVAKLKADVSVTAGVAAVQLIQAERGIKVAANLKLKEDAVAPVATLDAAVGSFASDAKLQAEFGDEETYNAFLEAE